MQVRLFPLLVCSTGADSADSAISATGKCYRPCTLCSMYGLYIEVGVNFHACVQSELQKWTGWHFQEYYVIRTDTG